VKKLVLLLLAIWLVALVPGCSATPKTAALNDDLGRAVKTGGVIQRIVSLAPSNTEILFALGLGAKVVATDDYSDYPNEAKSLKRVGSAFPGFSVESIAALKPDLVVAFGYQLPDYVSKLESLGIATVVLAPKDVNGVIGDIRLMGQITDTNAQAKNLIADMEKRRDAIVNKVKGATRPRVFWEFDATDPNRPWTAGPRSFNDSLITLAGGQNVGASGPTSSWQMGAEDIIKANPQIVILDDYQFGASVESVAKRPGWSSIAAVKDNAIFPITDPNLTDRPGPRVISGLELLARTIHPELFK
jgi:iron complex transport system substrate-binding protein